MEEQNPTLKLAAILATPREQLSNRIVTGAISTLLRPSAVVSAGDMATLAGVDALDRQRVKRKAARWADGFAMLPPLERLAVLVAIAERSVVTNKPRAPMVRTVGVAPKREGDSEATPLNEIIMAMACAHPDGIGVYHVNLALGNADIPHLATEVAIQGLARTGRLSTRTITRHRKTYHPTDKGLAWLAGRNVKAKGVAKLVAWADDNPKIARNTGTPTDMPPIRMVVPKTFKATPREWIGLPADATGTGDWSWRNLKTPPTRRVEIEPAAMREIEKALRACVEIPKGEGTGDPAIRRACLAYGVNAIRDAADANGEKLKRVGIRFQEEMARRGSVDTPVRFRSISRGHVYMTVEEAKVLADILGVDPGRIAPHLIVAPWIFRKPKS